MRVRTIVCVLLGGYLAKVIRDGVREDDFRVAHYPAYDRVFPPTN